MLEPQRQRTAMVAYPALFGGEQARPPIVVVDEANDTRLDTEGVSHRVRISLRSHFPNIICKGASRPQTPSVRHWQCTPGILSPSFPGRPFGVANDPPLSRQRRIRSQLRPDSPAVRRLPWLVRRPPPELIDQFLRVLGAWRPLTLQIAHADEQRYTCVLFHTWPESLRRCSVKKRALEMVLFAREAGLVEEAGHIRRGLLPFHHIQGEGGSNDAEALQPSGQVGCGTTRVGFTGSSQDGGTTCRAQRPLRERRIRPCRLPRPRPPDAAIAGSSWSTATIPHSRLPARAIRHPSARNIP